MCQVSNPSNQSFQLNWQKFLHRTFGKPWSQWYLKSIETVVRQGLEESFEFQCLLGVLAYRTRFAGCHVVLVIVSAVVTFNARNARGRYLAAAALVVAFKEAVRNEERQKSLEIWPK